MKRCLFGTIFLALVGTASAGQIHFVDSTLVSYSPATGFANHNAGSSYSLSGRSFGLSANCSPIVVGPGAILGNASATVSVQMRVKWTGAPGEPKPNGQAAYWTFTQKAKAQLIGGFNLMGSASYVTAGCNTNPDPGGANFNRTLTAMATTYDAGTITSYDSVMGGFDFHDAGGDWIGVGTFSIPVTITASGLITPLEYGGLVASVSSDVQLTAVGSWPVQ